MLLCSILPDIPFPVLERSLSSATGPGLQNTDYTVATTNNVSRPPGSTRTRDGDGTAGAGQAQGSNSGGAFEFGSAATTAGELEGGATEMGTGEIELNLVGAATGVLGRKARRLLKKELRKQKQKQKGKEKRIGKGNEGQGGKGASAGAGAGESGRCRVQSAECRASGADGAKLWICVRCVFS